MNKQIAEIKDFLSTEDVKRTVQDNYIKTIFALHPTVRKSAIIDHMNAIQLSGADPFKKQVYFTSYFSKKLGYAVGTTVYSYRFFEDQANKTNKLNGCPCEVTVDDYFDPIKGETVKTLKAIATAKRKDREDIIFTAWYPEFVQKDWKEKVNSIWASKPHLMLRKCAIAGALRSQFPEALGTFLIEEEVSTSENLDAEKITQLETDIESTVIKEEKIKQLIEKAKTIKRKTPIIEAITELSTILTMGMNKEEKINWMDKALKIDSLGRLEKFSIPELQTLLLKVEKLRDEPILVDSEIKSVKDVTFKLES